MSLLKSEKKEVESKVNELEAHIVENVDEKPTKHDKKEYDVVVNISPLNIRRAPSLGGEFINSLKAGDEKTIVEEKDGWGRLSDGGWVLLAYVSKK